MHVVQKLDSWQTMHSYRDFGGIKEMDVDWSFHGIILLKDRDRNRQVLHIVHVAVKLSLILRTINCISKANRTILNIMAREMSKDRDVT